MIVTNAPHGPFVLYRRHVEHRDGKVFVRDEAFDLTKAEDREMVRKLMDKAEELELEKLFERDKHGMVDTSPEAMEKALNPQIERAFPPPQPSYYETPITRAIHREYEEERLAHYLREHMEAARLRK